MSSLISTKNMMTPKDSDSNLLCMGKLKYYWCINTTGRQGEVIVLKETLIFADLHLKMSERYNFLPLLFAEHPRRSQCPPPRPRRVPWVAAASLMVFCALTRVCRLRLTHVILPFSPFPLVCSWCCMIATMSVSYGDSEKRLSLVRTSLLTGCDFLWELRKWCETKNRTMI